MPRFTPTGNAFLAAVALLCAFRIVGGGTAGLTIAARLAADPSITVAVIEAGGFYEVDAGLTSVIPGNAIEFVGTDPNNFQPLIDWGFSTTPQPGASNRKIHYARGKTLGGSSARNYMFYQRPTCGAMQMWADAVGDDTYLFENVLPFYEKSTHLTPQNPALYSNMSNKQTTANFSPYGGPLQVGYQNYVSPFATYTRPALEAIGAKPIDGFNSGSLLGSGFATWTVDNSNATRSSSESSFLQQAMATTTLQVYVESLAQKILFGPNNTATGVLVETQGTFGTPSLTYTLTANKEVILSAGAFQSPQLLMVSGIGPKAALQALNIPVVKDAPGVGQDMWDQISFAVGREVNVPTISAALNNPAIYGEYIEEYEKSASGPFSVFGGCYFGWEKIPEPARATLSNSTLQALSGFSADWPELEFLPVNAYLGDNKNYAIEDPLDGKNYASVAAGVMTPLSRGNVTITSANMADPPVINPNWLTDPADVETAVAAFKRVRNIWDELTTLGVTVGPEKLPGPSVQSDADIFTFISDTVIQLFHPTSTCKMGKSSDPMAVVDSRGKVFGTNSLRVVDASIFPFCPPGHPQATVYMVAELIADSILKGE
ncbi:hypothetical protein G7Y89_g2995 [Cudoniella acicularis]|uniref:Glucose-methanol-choline oxidoreductase N-terminal domain-containing protein n=1 Tax=Cudoniella acicularis TaxID=354080 RepID=A0A8H4RUC4_9HELO|nr:hypothetical protein G7Y89_g2995 [Cudoniella acicularis]